MTKIFNLLCARTLVAAACLGFAALTMTGCTSASRARIGSWGTKHHIKQFSGGELINEWHSTGVVEVETESDGYHFEDAATHTIVRVSGDIQITIED